MSEAHANASDCPAEPQLPAFAAQPRRVIHCHGLSVPVPLSHHRPEHARHIFQLCDDIRSMGWTPVKDLPHNTTDSMALLSRPIPEHDPKIVAHLTCLRDAITGKDIDRNTELSGLFHPESSEAPNVDQRLLRALTAVSPDVPCHMVLEDGLALPGDPWTKTHCECSLAFVNLYRAPVIRLTCRFKDTGSRLTLALDFHFSAIDVVKEPIANFQWTNYRDTWLQCNRQHISFTVSGATCSGFGKISRYRSRLHSSSLAMVREMQKLLRPDEPHKLCFLSDPDPASWQTTSAATLSKIRARLPGGSGPLLPSLSRYEFYNFGHGRDHIDFGEEVNLARPLGRMLQDDLPLPMIAQEATHTYGTLKQYEAENTFAVCRATGSRVKKVAQSVGGCIAQEQALQASRHPPRYSGSHVQRGGQNAADRS